MTKIEKSLPNFARAAERFSLLITPKSARNLAVHGHERSLQMADVSESDWKQMKVLGLSGITRKVY